MEYPIDQQKVVFHNEEKIWIFLKQVRSTYRKVFLKSSMKVTTKG